MSITRDPLLRLQQEFEQKRTDEAARRKRQKEIDARVKGEKHWFNVWLSRLPEDLTEEQQKAIDWLKISHGQPRPLANGGVFVHGLGVITVAEQMGGVADIDVWESLVARRLIIITLKDFATDAGEDLFLVKARVPGSWRKGARS